MVGATVSVQRAGAVQGGQEEKKLPWLDLGFLVDSLADFADERIRQGSGEIVRMTGDVALWGGVAYVLLEVLPQAYNAVTGSNVPSQLGVPKLGEMGIPALVASWSPVKRYALDKYVAGTAESIGKVFAPLGSSMGEAMGRVLASYAPAKG